jgi:hypothetical protein
LSHLGRSDVTRREGKTYRTKTSGGKKWKSTGAETELLAVAIPYGGGGGGGGS